MPTYSYKCTICDNRFEARQRFSDDPLTQCPKCQGLVRRVISSVGVVFKGSGFYVTDNRNGKANGGLNGTGRTDKKSDGEKTAEKSKEKNENFAASNKSSTETTSAGNAS